MLTSCGSLTKRDDHIIIDTLPRGADLKHKGKSLGTTPLVIKRFTHAKNEITLNGEKFKINCSLDWTNSLIPNFIGAYTLSGIGLYFLAIDYYRDEIRTCPQKLSFKLNNSDEKTKPKRVIYLPIKEIGNIKESKFLSKIEEKLLKIVKSKDQVIDYKSSLEQFLPYGVTEDKQWTLESIDPNVLMKIAYQKGITHVVEVKTDDKNTIEVAVKDFFSHKKVSHLKLAKKNFLDDGFTVKNLSSRFFYFFPNAITLLSTQGGFNQSDERKEIDSNTTSFNENVDHPNTLPGLLKYFSIDTVVSPYYYGTYDTDSFFAPSASFFSWRSKVYNLDEESLNPVFDYNVDAISGLFTMDYRFALITPAGSVSTGFGLGMGIFDIHDEKKGHSLYTTAIVKFQVDYTLFLTDRVYFNLGLENFSMGDRVVKIAGKEYDNVSITSVGFGYFLPETRLWLD